jgi:pimeloyl-ACP methyl ester carboxylesterase
MGTHHRAFDHLGEVSCPVTIAHGSDTASVSAELAQRQTALLPDGRLEELEGLGHFGPLTHPAMVAAGVVQALLGP